MSLQREIETYRKRLEELLLHEGKYVVIHGEEVLGIYSKLDEALRHGFERYGDKAFLARQISKSKRVLLSSRGLRQCPWSPES